MPTAMQTPRKRKLVMSIATTVPAILLKSALYRLELRRYGLQNRENKKSIDVKVFTRECIKCCRW